MTAGGAGPAAWNYNVSTLYMTKDAFGIKKEQAYVGAEIGGMLFNFTSSLGVYANISGHKNSPKLFVSVSVGVMNLYEFLRFITKIPQ